MKIFIDTSAFISYFRQDENNHREVSDKFEFYQKLKARLFTSDYILDELFTWLPAKYSRAVVEGVFYLCRSTSRERGLPRKPIAKLPKAAPLKIVDANSGLVVDNPITA